MYHQLTLKYQHRLTKQKLKEKTMLGQETIVLVSPWKESFKLKESENSQSACVDAVGPAKIYSTVQR